MQIYSAIFPVKESLTQDKLINLVIEWNQGSPYNKINNLVWDGKNRNVKFEDGNLSLAIEEIRAYNTIAIRFHQLDDHHIIWNTDIVVNFDKHIFSIKLDRETTTDTVGFIPKFKTPVIVNKLLDGGYVAPDFDIPICKNEIEITQENYEIIKDIICKNKIYAMPVVYVTKSWGKYPCRVRELAYRLRGVAHVLKEEDEKVANILKEVCDGKNAHHGSIGIYYPNESSMYKIILTSRYENREDALIDKIVKLVCTYVNQKARDKMLTWEGVQNELLRLRYNTATKKKVIAENEVYEVYENFGDEIEKKEYELEKKEHEIEELNNRIMALQAENQGLRAKYDQNSEAVPILYYGIEEELYEGEIKDQVIELLERQLKHVKKGTRKHHILDDILEYNEPTGILKQRQEDIKQILKGYKKVDKKLKKDLTDFGFVISKEGGHYKLEFQKDSRYLFTMAASGSDGRHGGGNLAAEIKSDLL